MADEVEHIQVTKLDISPNNCPLNAGVSLDVEFTTDQEFPNSVWEVKYILDYTGKRLQIELGQTEMAQYSKGHCSFHFSIASLRLDDSAHSKKILCNVGLLLAVLKSDGEEVVQLSMVTQVTKQADGQLMRTVFSPIE